MQFPVAARERIAIASYPFRDFIAGREDKPGSGKMELKEFAAHVSAKFNIKKIEPWSEHFFFWRKRTWKSCAREWHGRAERS